MNPGDFWRIGSNKVVNHINAIGPVLDREVAILRAAGQFHVDQIKRRIQLAANLIGDEEAQTG